MRRGLLNLLTALSLLLCVASVAVWVRSYWVSDRISRASVGRDGGSVVKRSAEFSTGRGVVLVCVMSDWWKMSDWAKDPAPLGPSATRWERTRHAPPLPSVAGPSTRQVLGFFSAGHDGVVARNGTRVHFLGFPLWLPAAVFALLPMVRFYRRVRRRPQPGCCAQCGYDLRATPGRCPECGTAIAT